MITLEIRLFNLLRRYAQETSPYFKLSVPEGTTYAKLLGTLKIPEKEVFLALRDGRNIELLASDEVLRNGEVVALSGPVPFSRGYGAPII